jgi:putative Mg2+ transporter-C (MgtC) family protein
MDTTILSVAIAAPMQHQNLLDLTLRLGLAIVAGGSIGLDRYLHNKAGGLRTHMLVSLGSALFTIVPIALTDRTDISSVSRVVQGIAAGVGFLGAGEIIHRSNSTTPDRVTPLQAKGLTSAASIWVTAALGIVAGCGLWQLAIVATTMTIGILTCLKYLESRTRE